MAYLNTCSIVDMLTVCCVYVSSLWKLLHVPYVWSAPITCPQAATARPTLCDALRASVCPRALPMGMRAQVCLVFVTLHRSIMCIYVVWLLGEGLVVRSDYMVKRFVYLSVSTHTLIPSLYLLLYPLSGASRVTRMLQLNRDQGTTLG